jgi:enoyl-CoA hydratase/carnithine racemase
VNAFDWNLRKALERALRDADSNARIDAIVLTGAGRGFSAGGDLGERGTPAHSAAPTLAKHIQPLIESLCKPVIAALHGFAIGGGFETALGCHYRVARSDTRIALPEVRHGLIPPSGSQRLPRAIGVEAALKLMLGPLELSATELNAAAGDAGLDPLFDRCTSDDPVQQALDLAEELGISSRHRDDLQARLLRHRKVPAAGAESALAAAQASLRDGAFRPARQACIDAIRAAAFASDFDTGMQQAWDRFVELRDGHPGA